MTRFRIIAVLCGCLVLLTVVLSAQPQRKDSIPWYSILNNNVVASKVAITTVAVTVTAGQPSGASAAAPTLVGGTVLGIRSAGNQDQFVDNVVLGGTGAVTVTLAANATANNTFSVTVLRTRP